MKYLANDHKDRRNQHENSCKLCYESGCPLLNYLFNCDSLHARQNSHHEAWSYKKKKHKKIKAYRKSVRKEPRVKRCQRKGKQRRSKESILCAENPKLQLGTRKEPADRDILLTSWNGDRKIMQSIRITSNGVTLLFDE